MATTPTGAKQRRKGRRGNAVVELIVIIGVALLLALGIQAWLVKPFRIPSESMVPTLSVGQRVLVDRISEKLGSSPGRGDIVVFKPPKGADTNQCGISQPPGEPCPQPTADRSNSNFIKRVVAVGGDRIKVLGNHVWLNGKQQSEPFINPQTPCADLCNMPHEITIPSGSFFMMGDNRGQSADSREWGPVPRKWIIGRAFFTYWPPDRIGFP